jgi:DNA-binding MarR family transcriptional regulator
MESFEELFDRAVDGLFNILVEQHGAHVSEIELTLPQVQALRLLAERKAMTTGSLAAAIGISAPAVTQLMDRLSFKKLVTRAASDLDRRSVVIELTADGRRTIDGLRRRRNEVFRGLLQRIDREQRGQFVEALALMAGALDATSGERLASRAGAVNRETAREAPPASNPGGQTVTRLTRRRMRIEWD